MTSPAVFLKNYLNFVSFFVNDKSNMSADFNHAKVINRGKRKQIS